MDVLEAMKAQWDKAGADTTQFAVLENLPGREPVQVFPLSRKELNDYLNVKYRELFEHKFFATRKFTVDDFTLQMSADSLHYSINVGDVQEKGSVVAFEYLAAGEGKYFVCPNYTLEAAKSEGVAVLNSEEGFEPTFFVKHGSDALALAIDVCLGANK